MLANERGFSGGNTELKPDPDADPLMFCAKMLSRPPLQELRGRGNPGLYEGETDEAVFELVFELELAVLERAVSVGNLPKRWAAKPGDGGGLLEASEPRPGSESVMGRRPGEGGGLLLDSTGWRLGRRPSPSDGGAADFGLPKASVSLEGHAWLLGNMAGDGGGFPKDIDSLPGQAWLLGNIPGDGGGLPKELDSLPGHARALGRSPDGNGSSFGAWPSFIGKLI